MVPYVLNPILKKAKILVDSYGGFRGLFGVIDQRNEGVLVGLRKDQLVALLAVLQRIFKEVTPNFNS